MRFFPIRHFRLEQFLPILGIDVISNLTEIFVRLGTDALTTAVLLRLVIVGIGRTVLAVVLLASFDAYGLSILRKDDRIRYRKLLLLTSQLKSEVIWMNKNTSRIEETMAVSYSLFNELNAKEGMGEIAQKALTVAKDIHEVKKEYYLIMNGISDALNTDQEESGMWMKNIFGIMQESVRHVFGDYGQNMRLDVVLEKNFYTDKHYYLMSVLRNLINNAAEAAGNRHARVVLSGKEDGEDYVIGVHDDCGGIDEEYLPTIFMPGFSTKINYETGQGQSRTGAFAGQGYCGIRAWGKHQCNFGRWMYRLYHPDSKRKFGGGSMMKIYLIDDDASVCNILKIIIQQKKLGEVCGTASNGMDALEDLAYVSPDIVVVDLLMPIMDGINFVRKAKEQYPDISYVMLSQVSSKEMISQAYECGVTFFIQKPVNGMEVVRVLTNVIDSIQMRRTFNQMQSLFLKDTPPNAAAAPIPEIRLASEQPAEEKPHIKRLRSILQKLGIIGESGSADIITLVDYMIEQGPESGKFTVSELCSKFSPNNSKSMEQRIRRTVNAGLTNLANMGIEDYSNDTFHDFAGSIYSFEQIRKEMDYIRGKSDSHGKVSLKNFLNSLIFYCTN